VQEPIPVLCIGTCALLVVVCTITEIKVAYVSDQLQTSFEEDANLLFIMQKPIFALWIGTCALMVVVCLRASHDDYNELFHIYYQPLIIMLAMFWLWGVAMRIFELMKIQYQACFSEKEQHHLLNSRQVYQVCCEITETSHNKTPQNPANKKARKLRKTAIIIMTYPYHFGCLGTACSLGPFQGSTTLSAAAKWGLKVAKVCVWGGGGASKV
jgi:hypothetical protein